MEILPMLARLEHALGCPNLTKQMVLLPTRTRSRSSSEDINLIVGYNGSAKSQTALDLTLWIAYQTRLATRKSVTVQVVYVIDTKEHDRSPAAYLPESATTIAIHPCFASLNRSEQPVPLELVAHGEALSPSVAVAEMDSPSSSNWQIYQFERADQILWQARCLANEWRGSLETHLRFGHVAEELFAVADRVSTTALILGCSSVAHPIVQALRQDIPFSVLGIPHLPNH